MSVAFPRDIEFHKLLARRTDIDLVRLMLEFAADAYPRLDEAASLSELERLGRRARDCVGSARSEPGDLHYQLAAVSDMLYSDEGFAGNDENYYDPRNSYLNQVLERRSGIPISLGIVYVCVAGRAGLPVYGVGTPGHFVLGCQQDGETFYIDPYSGGDVLSRAECQCRIESVLGQRGVLSDEHFRPATAFEIATRVLRNLKAAYVMQSHWNEVLPVQCRLALMLPEIADERRDLGLIYLRTGHGRPALELLEQYVEGCQPDEAETLAPYLRSARRMSAERN
jgi:regulator of sirC expression with transglutaminase-like and TPR domain